jgi:hypothetical protein
MLTRRRFLATSATAPLPARITTMDLKHPRCSRAPFPVRTFCLRKRELTIFLLGILVGGCESPTKKSSESPPLKPEVSDTSLQILMRQSEGGRLREEAISNQIRELNRARIPSSDGFVNVEISGNVPTPGRLQLPEASDLSMALVKMGGVIASKSMATVQITRLTADESSFHFEIEIHLILKGKSSTPDLILQNGDKIFVPP